MERMKKKNDMTRKFERVTFFSSGFSKIFTTKNAQEFDVFRFFSCEVQ